MFWSMRLFRISGQLQRAKKIACAWVEALQGAQVQQTQKDTSAPKKQLQLVKSFQNLQFSVRSVCTCMTAPTSLAEL